MPKRTSATGSELFIVSNSNMDRKVLRYLDEWCQIFRSIDIATGSFDIGLTSWWARNCPSSCGP